MVWKYSVLFLPRLRWEQFGAADCIGAMVLGAVPRDQHVAVEDPHGIQPAALLQFGYDIGEHDRAPPVIYCVSVSGNVRRKRPSIARRAVHHCAPLQVYGMCKRPPPNAYTLSDSPESGE